MSIAIGKDKKGNKIKVYKSLVNGKWLAVKEDTHNKESNTELCYRPFDNKDDAMKEAMFILLQDYISSADEIDDLINSKYINIKYDFMKEWNDNNGYRK